jgi:hypothetical protein
MIDRLSRQERLRIVAELCPKYGMGRPCDSFELARDRALEILGPAERAAVTADYVLMRAIDRFAAGQLSLADLYRCRVLAYYMTFASGGEEWARWGVAAAIRPGEFTPQLDGIDLEDLLPPAPDGPPWRNSGAADVREEE